MTAPRRRFLDEPYIVERLTLEYMQDLVRPLLHPGSPLPARLRAQLARIQRRLMFINRELRLHPGQVAAEKAAEESPP
jgi:hypothetical protein